MRSLSSRWSQAIPGVRLGRRVSCVGMHRPARDRGARTAEFALHRGDQQRRARSQPDRRCAGRGSSRHRRTRRRGAWTGTLGHGVRRVFLRMSPARFARAQSRTGMPTRRGAPDLAGVAAQGSRDVPISLRPDRDRKRSARRSRDIFGTHSAASRPLLLQKSAKLQGLLNAGGGTRTPDTRIMIPLL
jgi:hypothetical protein